MYAGEAGGGLRLVFKDKFCFLDKANFNLLRAVNVVKETWMEFVYYYPKIIIVNNFNAITMPFHSRKYSG